MPKDFPQQAGVAVLAEVGNDAGVPDATSFLGLPVVAQKVFDTTKVVLHLLGSRKESSVAHTETAT